LPGEYQGIESFVVGLSTKCAGCPSRDGALEVIGVSGKISLTDNDLYIFEIYFKNETKLILLKYSFMQGGYMKRRV